MNRRERTAQREVARLLRCDGLSWVAISWHLQARWPSLSPRAALRVAHGWTQADSAEAWSERWPDTPKTDKEIGIWEIRRPGFATLGKLAQLYQCSVADLVTDVENYRHLDEAEPTDDSTLVDNLTTTIGSDDAGPDRPVVAQRTTEPFDVASLNEVGLGRDMMVLPGRDSCGEMTFVIVSRRDVLRSLGALTLATLTPDTIIERPGQIRGQLIEDHTPIEHFERVRSVLIEADSLHGPASVLPTAYEQIALLERLRTTASPSDLRSVCRLLAQFAEFVAWLNQDLCDLTLAQRWLDRAMAYTPIAGDAALTTFIVARQSQLSGDTGDCVAAVHYATAAAALAPGDDRLAALAATYEAHGHALAGDDYATERAYDQSLNMLTSSSSGSTHAWDSWLNASYISAQHARSLLALGHGARAADSYDHTLATLPPGLRRERGVHLA